METSFCGRRRLCKAEGLPNDRTGPPLAPTIHTETTMRYVIYIGLCLGPALFLLWVAWMMKRESRGRGKPMRPYDPDEHP